VDNNVIDFMKYKQARDDIETEIMREDILEFLMNVGDYTPDTFTFTIDDDEELPDG